VHRIGRTGRAGRLGKAYTIATPHDDKYLGAIEALVKMPIPRGSLPEGFALEDAADAPSDRPREANGRSGSSRSAGSRGRSSSTPTRERDSRPPREEKTVAIEVIETRAEPKAEPRVDPRPARQEPWRDDRREGLRDSGRDFSRDRRDPPRDRRDNVVGMGDHVPDFILRSFKIAAATVDDMDDTPANGTEG
jgi:superfamily II DNA/RNA helicase